MRGRLPTRLGVVPAIVDPSTAASGGAHSGSTQGFCIWLTGLSGAGKTTVSRLLKESLEGRGLLVEVVDGDEVRSRLYPELGYSREDRDTSVHRIARMASELVHNGAVVIVAVISPYRDARESAQREVGAHGRCIEVYVDAPLDICEARDVKGLYARARAGELTGFTGVDDPYEPPPDPHLTLRTSEESPQDSAKRVLALLDDEDLL